MEFTQILVVAILIEAIWENVKMVWQNGKFSIDKIGALVISILVCVLVKADVFALVNLGIAVPYVGSVLTGILVSRGANFIHGLFNKINN
jgi:chromate transport protein ChrA